MQKDLFSIKFNFKHEFNQYLQKKKKKKGRGKANNKSQLHHINTYRLQYVITELITMMKSPI